MAAIATNKLAGTRTNTLSWRNPISAPAAPTRPVITVALHLDTQPAGPSQGHKRVKSGHRSSLCKITYQPFQITGAAESGEVPPENSVGSDRHASEQVGEPNRALFPADAK